MDFPRRQLSIFLSSWYREQVDSALRPPKAPQDLLLTGGSVFDVQPELTSLNAVFILVKLTDILGFEPKKSVIKRGGYRSEAEFAASMLANLERALTARQGAVGASVAKGASHVSR